MTVLVFHVRAFMGLYATLSNTNITFSICCGLLPTPFRNESCAETPAVPPLTGQCPFIANSEEESHATVLGEVADNLPLDISVGHLFQICSMCGFPNSMHAPTRVLLGMHPGTGTPRALVRQLQNVIDPDTLIRERLLLLQQLCFSIELKQSSSRGNMKENEHAKKEAVPTFCDSTASATAIAVPSTCNVNIVSSCSNDPASVNRSAPDTTRVGTISPGIVATNLTDINDPPAKRIRQNLGYESNDFCMARAPISLTTSLTTLSIFELEKQLVYVRSELYELQDPRVRLQDMQTLQKLRTPAPLNITTLLQDLKMVGARGYCQEYITQTIHDVATFIQSKESCAQLHHDARLADLASNHPPLPMSHFSWVNA